MAVLEGEEREKEACCSKTNKQTLRISQTWGRNWVYKFMKLREYLVTYMQKNLLQNTVY